MQMLKKINKLIMYNTAGNNENLYLLQIIKPEVSFMHDQFMLYLTFNN